MRTPKKIVAPGHLQRRHLPSDATSRRMRMPWVVPTDGI